MGQGELSVASGLARDRGCGEAQGGQEFPSSELLGMPRQRSEGEMLQVSSSSQLLQPRLPGLGLGDAAPKKVHFDFNLIKRINNYRFGLIISLSLGSPQFLLPQSPADIKGCNMVSGRTSGEIRIFWSVVGYFLSQRVGIQAVSWS